MGRPTLPTAIKRLKGTLQPCRTNPNEPVIEPGVPSADLITLSPTAQRLWPRFVEAIQDTGVLTPVDGAAFTFMVEAFADWTDCNEVIQTEGRMLSKVDRFGVVTHYANPVVAMASDAQKRFLAFAIQFGLTPASRAKVTAAIVKQEYNPFEDIENDK